jgi:protein phosphatase
VGTRESNEDSFLSLVGDMAPSGTLALLAVADGIGGRGTGASASSMALSTLADVFSAGCSVASSTLSDVPHLLRFAVQKANATVFRAQCDDETLRGMGTTCVTAAVTEDSISVVSIGDSRAYLFRDGQLMPLTEDEWTKRDDGVTLVGRAIGWQPLLPTEPAVYEIREGDQVILCTDGLTDALSDESIRDLLQSNNNGTACLTLYRPRSRRRTRTTPPSS